MNRRGKEFTKEKVQMKSMLQDKAKEKDQRVKECRKEKAKVQLHATTEDKWVIWLKTARLTTIAFSVVHVEIMGTLRNFGR